VIGRLRHLLSIEARVETGDGAGGVTVTWVAVGQAWGRIEPLPGREDLSADRERTVQRWRVTVRYRDDLTPAHRFVSIERHFDIQAIADRDGRRRFLVCECVEEEGS